MAGSGHARASHAGQLQLWDTVESWKASHPLSLPGSLACRSPFVLPGIRPMTRYASLKICHHIQVRELIREAGAAHLGFQVKRSGDAGQVVDEDIELAIPYPVLESLAAMLPQVLADMRARGIQRIPDAGTAVLETAGDIAGEILGLSFGTYFPKIDAVMTGVTVLAYEQGQRVQRMGPPMLFNLSLLKDLQTNLPIMLAHMKQHGAVVDTFAPPTIPVAPWDAGPQLGMEKARYLCQGLHVRGFDLERGAAVLRIMVNEADGSDGKIKSADYFLPFRVMNELGPSIKNFLFNAQDPGQSTRAH